MEKDNKFEINLNGSLKGLGANLKSNEYRPAFSYDQETSKIVDFFIKYSNGIIKDKMEVIYCLLAFFVLIFVIFYITIGFNNEKKVEIRPPTGQKIIYPEKAPPNSRTL